MINLTHTAKDSGKKKAVDALSPENLKDTIGITM